MAQIGQDLLNNRTVAAGSTDWGTATDTQVWVTSGDAAIVYAASAAAGGTIKAAATNSDSSSYLGNTTSAPVNIFTKFKMSSNQNLYGCCFRATAKANANQYEAYWYNGSLIIEKKVGGATTVLASQAIALSGGSVYKLRVIASGTALSATLWLGSNTEPSSPTVSVTDSTYTAAGYFGVFSSITSGVTTTVTEFTALDTATTSFLRDIVTRFRQRSANQLRDVKLRFIQTAAPTAHTRDVALRFRQVAWAGGALRVTIGLADIPILNNSVKYSRKAGDRAQASFSIADNVGYNLLEDMPVTVYDTVQNMALYAGYIDKIDDTRLPGTSGVTAHVVTCKDVRWLAEKRIYTGPEFNEWNAGAVVASLHQQVLGQEGVTAAYALRHDQDASGFSQGTLTGVTAGADGTLSLAKAGADIVQNINTTAEWNAGVVTGLSTAGNVLSLASVATASLIAILPQNQNFAESYDYRTIWIGSITVNAGDHLWYNLWVDPTSPEVTIAVDILFSDGSYMKNGSAVDTNGRKASPATDLSKYAKNKWYNRCILIGDAHAGKSISAVMLGTEGNAGGTYKAFFQNIFLANSSDVLRQQFFGSTLSVNQQASNDDYTSISVSLVSGAGSGTYVNTIDLTPLGIIAGSFINWQAATPATSNTTTSPGVLVETSINGGTFWHTCTNRSAISGLLPGLSGNGRSLIVRITLSIDPANPTVSPVVQALNLTITSAPASAKVDVWDTDATQAQFGTGTLAGNVINNPVGLQLSNVTRNWDDGVLTSQNTFGTASPSVAASNGQCILTTNSGTDVKSQLAFAGQWKNFTAEVDVMLNSANGDFGLCYRTTGWNNNNDTYAYVAQLRTGQVVLAHGTNGGTGAYTQLGSTVTQHAAGHMYRMKVVVNGNLHQIYIDGALMLSVTDSTYPNQGYLGLRAYSNSGTQSVAFDNFGVAANLSPGVRTHPDLSLTSVGTVGNSLIQWVSDEPSGSSILVESSINGGSTWTACTNGAAIPGLTPGLSVVGTILKVRETLSINDADVVPTLMGISSLIMGAYSASGSRVTPALACDTAGVIGSSSVSYVGVTPPNTTLLIDTSPDGSTWTSGVASGAPVVGLNAQGDLWWDSFDSDTSANYAFIPL